MNTLTIRNIRFLINPYKNNIYTSKEVVDGSFLYYLIIEPKKDVKSILFNYYIPKNFVLIRENLETGKETILEFTDLKFLKKTNYKDLLKTIN